MLRPRLRGASGTGANHTPSFTLTEVLVASFVCLTLAGALFRAVAGVSSAAARFFGDSAAWANAQAVLSAIELRALHAGAGLKDMGGLPAPFPSAVTVLKGDGTALAERRDGVYGGEGIALVYTIPSALKAKPSTAPSTSVTLLGQSANMALISDRIALGNRSNIESWVAFPLSGQPVSVNGYSGGKLTLSSAALIAPYDEMCYIEAIRYAAKDGFFRSSRFRTDWGDTIDRAEGILALWFEWRPDLRVLDAWVLADAGANAPPQGQGQQKSLRPTEWPEAAPWREEFGGHNLLVAMGSWRVDNM
ncbi:MAG: hypothetical protein LBR38_02240 [Synergistaceae bacterium]|jgi:hypothetical protein|nr:hypothetical protein [Synergistaceae bacterium]